MNTLVLFAETEKATGGLGALGINIQGFAFQLITFVLVLLFLNRFAFKKIGATLEARRQAVIDSLDKAKEAADELAKANETTADLIKVAQTEAAAIVATAQKEASKAIEDAGAKATKKADHVLEQAEARIASEVAAARDGLRSEMIDLVALATEKVIQQKLDSKSDAALIKKALEDA